MKFSVSVTFFCDGTGRDVTDGIWTDRFFSENIILDAMLLTLLTSYQNLSERIKRVMLYIVEVVIT